MKRAIELWVGSVLTCAVMAACSSGPGEPVGLGPTASVSAAAGGDDGEPAMSERRQASGAASVAPEQPGAAGQGGSPVVSAGGDGGAGPVPELGGAGGEPLGGDAGDVGAGGSTVPGGEAGAAHSAGAPACVHDGADVCAGRECGTALTNCGESVKCGSSCLAEGSACVDGECVLAACGKCPAGKLCMTVVGFGYQCYSIDAPSGACGTLTKPTPGSYCDGYCSGKPDGCSETYSECGQMVDAKTGTACGICSANGKQWACGAKQ
jgi:hypothetical protein